MTSRSSHWPKMAANWRLVGPPLRPAPADINCFQAAIDAWISDSERVPRALILGVTPELYFLQWPAQTRLMALDQSTEMIAALWPGDRANVLLGSWTDVPLDDHSQDIILLDGGFGVVSHPEGQRRLLSEIRRILSPGGLFILRLFAPAGRTGSLAEIGADLRAGRVASLDALKLRVWGALQKDLKIGVRPREVVAAIDTLSGGDSHRLVSDYGWSRDHVSTLELHRRSDAIYHLADVEDLQRMLDSFPGLKLHSVALPDHEFGPCCPVVSLQNFHYRLEGKNRS